MAALRGYLDESHQPRIPIVVQGARRDLTLEAVIDTGFDGELCLPVAVAIELGLELYGAQRVQLADGSIKSELVFLGQAGFVDQLGREGEILLTEGEDALIGVSFLLEWRLEIDFPREIVRLHPKARPRRRKSRS